MPYSTSGRRSQGTRKEILPRREWRFSEHPSGKRVHHAAKSFTSRSRRIVHLRPKNKAATLFKPEAWSLSSGRLPTGDQKVKTQQIPRRLKDTAQVQPSAAFKGEDYSIPWGSKGQESTCKDFRTIRQRQVRRGLIDVNRGGLAMAEPSSGSLPVQLVKLRIDAFREPLLHQAVRDTCRLAFRIFLPCLVPWRSL